MELQYRKPFLEIWEDEKNDRELGPLSERMGVRDRQTGELSMTEEEKEAVSKYTQLTVLLVLCLPLPRLLPCFLLLQGVKEPPLLL